MEAKLKERLRVVGEMAETFFPPGFCGEVLELADNVPNAEAAEVLAAYDFFLQTQHKYQTTAHEVYRDLVATMRGEAKMNEEWRLDFLVDNAHQPYDDEAIRPLKRAVAECLLKPMDHYNGEDLRRLMEAVGELVFYMGDSPAYPSERPLKFYQFLYSGGKLRTISYSSLIRRLLHHSASLLEEHRKASRMAKTAWSPA